MTPQQIEKEYKAIERKYYQGLLLNFDYFNKLINLGFKKSFLKKRLQRFINQELITDDEIQIEKLINEKAKD